VTWDGAGAGSSSRVAAITLVLALTLLLSGFRYGIDVETPTDARHGPPHRIFPARAGSDVWLASIYPMI